jgi:hypothetical protein
MMDIFAAIVSFFITGPLQAELSERMNAARAPATIVTDVMTCAGAAAPLVVQRVLSDPGWALTQTFNVWTGQRKAEAVLLDAAPACSAAIEAAGPFLRGDAGA